jgi:hypothetical protein
LNLIRYEARKRVQADHFQVEALRMGVSGRARTGDEKRRKWSHTIQKSCSEPMGQYLKCTSGSVVKKKARAGWAEAGSEFPAAVFAVETTLTGQLLQPIACKRGIHHVRTLYGEGTARDLLRAI